MGLAAPRFTIRSLMIAVAITAALLGLFRIGLLPLVLLALSGPLYISLIGMWWWMFRRFRRLSALCFGTAAGVVNVSGIVCSILSVRFRWGATHIRGLVRLVPTCPRGRIGLGREVDPQRFEPPQVPAMGVALGYHRGRRGAIDSHHRVAQAVGIPSLPGLADGASGRPRCGREGSLFPNGRVFGVVGSESNRTTGRVNLFVDANPGGRSGFAYCPSCVPQAEQHAFSPFDDLLGRPETANGSFFNED